MSGQPTYFELGVADADRARAFYSGLFGWTKDQAMDMGEMGVYQLFAAGAGAVGAMMTKPADCPRPFWNFYFNVEAIDAAQARVEAGGGKVVTGPMEVPNEQWIIQCLDPQGAFFSLVAPHR
jgi:predicted enzyme related to lactoylglutathione lyase